MYTSLSVCVCTLYIAILYVVFSYICVYRYKCTKMYIHKAELDLVDADGSLFSTFHPFIQCIDLDR